MARPGSLPWKSLMMGRRMKKNRLLPPAQVCHAGCAVLTTTRILEFCLCILFAPCNGAKSACQQAPFVGMHRHWMLSVSSTSPVLICGWVIFLRLHLKCWMAVLQVLLPRKFLPSLRARQLQTARGRPLQLPRNHLPKSPQPKRPLSRSQQESRSSQMRRCQMLTLRYLLKKRMSSKRHKLSSQALVKVPRARRAAKGLLPTGLVLDQSKQGLLQVHLAIFLLQCQQHSCPITCLPIQHWCTEGTTTMSADDCTGAFTNRFA